MFDGVGPNNGIIVRLRAKPSLGVFLSPPSPANRSRLRLPQHPGAGRQAPSTHGGPTRPFLLPDSRHRARGDVSRVTPARGEGCFPCPACTTLPAALHRALPPAGSELSRAGRRHRGGMTGHGAGITPRCQPPCPPRAALAPTGSCLASQGVRWDLPGAAGTALSPCTAAPGGLDRPHPRREPPHALHYPLIALNNPLSKALIPWQTRVRCRAPEPSAASPSTPES